MKKTLFFLCVGIFLIPRFAFASVIIKIRAVNPLEEKAAASIDYPLPPEITPEDVTDHRIVFSKMRTEKDIPELSEFKIVYKEEKQSYYVQQEIELLPKEVATLEVSVKDVWFIDQKGIEMIKGEISDIEKMLEKNPAKKTDTVMALKSEIFQEIDKIMERQNKNTIDIAGVQKHIKAYRENVSSLKQLFLDVSMLRNLIDSRNDQREEKGKSK